MFFGLLESVIGVDCFGFQCKPPKQSRDLVPFNCTIIQTSLFYCYDFNCLGGLGIRDLKLQKDPM